MDKFNALVKVTWFGDLENLQDQRWLATRRHAGM
jgi:hypothetical protein